MVWLSLALAGPVDVVVANRDVARGVILRESHVRVESREEGSAPDSYSSSTAVQYRRTLAPIRAGEAITPAHLTHPESGIGLSSMVPRGSMMAAWKHRGEPLQPGSSVAALREGCVLASDLLVVGGARNGKLLLATEERLTAGTHVYLAAERATVARLLSDDSLLLVPNPTEAPPCL